MVKTLCSLIWKPLQYLSCLQNEIIIDLHLEILYTIYLQCIQANNSVVWVTDVAHCNLFHIIYYFILIKFMYF